MTETNQERESRYCRQTKVIQTHHVFPFDSNYHGTLFGGKLMSMIDDCAAISGERFGRTTNVTASVDTLNFIKPLPTGHSVCIDTFVFRSREDVHGNLHKSDRRKSSDG